MWSKNCSKTYIDHVFLYLLPRSRASGVKIARHKASLSRLEAMLLVNRNARREDKGYMSYSYDNSTVSLRIASYLPVIITTTTRKVFMAFISKVIKERITNLINRYGVSKIPAHIINQLGVEKETTSTQ